MLRTFTILTAFLYASTLSMAAHGQRLETTFVNDCLGEITAPGIFILQKDLTAFPSITGPDGFGAPCFIVSSVRVKIKLNGFDIIPDGFGVPVEGIRIAASRVQVLGPGVIGVFDVGIQIAAVSDVKVREILFLQNETGIQLTSTSNSVIEGNILWANGVGIILDEMASDNIISGNEVFSNAEFGIFLEGSANNNTVSRNNVSSNGIEAPDGLGSNIVLNEDTEFNIVQDNIALDRRGDPMTGFDIVDVGTSLNNVVSNNVCEFGEPEAVCPATAGEPIPRFEGLHF